MTSPSTIRTSLALAGATGFAALAVLAAATPGAQVSADRDCGLARWSHILTGHWGGGCR
jgi:hypothetical protein